MDKLDIHIKHNIDSHTSPDPEIDMIHIRETTEPPASPDSAVTIDLVSENNPSLNLQPGTPMLIKSFILTSKCLAKLQKIFRQQTQLNQLNRYFASQVQVMKGKNIPHRDY